MDFSATANAAFSRATADYHLTDSIDAPAPNPYPEGSLERQLYHKCWIDVAQWHMEDLIRDPHASPDEVVALKRRIDTSNQDRTDCVEAIDTYFRDHFADVVPDPDAALNTETPAWAIDRLSILAIKIYHMAEQTCRPDATPGHRALCASKLQVLREQRADLSRAINSLLDDIAAGRKYMKVYRQMKMYNDASTNPVLYNRQNQNQNKSPKR